MRDMRDKLCAADREQMRSIIALGDTSKLVLVLRNLLSNALKFTPSGGDINISGIV